MPWRPAPRWLGAVLGLSTGWPRGGVVGEAAARLAGLRLHLLNEARLSAADAVLEGVRLSVRTTSAQATAALRLAQDLGDRFGLIAEALNDGAVSLPQAEAIVAGLKKLPPRLTRAQLVECQETILGYVDILGPSELRALATRLVEVVDPDLAEADDAKRLAARNGPRIAGGSCGWRRTITGRCGSRVSCRWPMRPCSLRSWCVDADAVVLHRGRGGRRPGGAPRGRARTAHADRGRQPEAPGAWW